MNSKKNLWVENLLTVLSGLGIIVVYFIVNYIAYYNFTFTTSEPNFLLKTLLLINNLGFVLILTTILSFAVIKRKVSIGKFLILTPFLVIVGLLGLLQTESEVKAYKKEFNLIQNPQVKDYKFFKYYKQFPEMHSGISYESYQHVDALKAYFEKKFESSGIPFGKWKKGFLSENPNVIVLTFDVGSPGISRVYLVRSNDRIQKVEVILEI